MSFGWTSFAVSVDEFWAETFAEILCLNSGNLTNEYTHKATKGIKTNVKICLDILLDLFLKLNKPDFFLVTSSVLGISVTSASGCGLLMGSVSNIGVFTLSASKLTLLPKTKGVA